MKLLNKIKEKRMILILVISFLIIYILSLVGVDKNILLTSMLLPFLVSILVLLIEKDREKEKKRNMLDINLKILIKDIQDLINYLEKIIYKKEIKDNFYLQELNINQILIDYNTLYSNEKETQRIIKNLLEIDKIRTSVKEEFTSKIKLPDYLDRKMNINNKNNIKKSSYIFFIQDTYKELDNIFIENNLLNQLKKIEPSFKFKPLKEIKKERKELLINRIEELEKEINKIEKDYNVKQIYTKDLSELTGEERKLRDEIEGIEGSYHWEKRQEELSYEGPKIGRASCRERV